MPIPMNEFQFTAGEDDAGNGPERLDRFLCRRLDGLISREKIKKYILEGRVSLDGEPCLSPKRAVLIGETVRLCPPEAAPGLPAEAGELEIVYEDEHLAVLVKPHGLSTHPSPNEPSGTLVNRLLARFPALRELEGERPGIVHRLDKDTTGLLLVALNEPARLELAGAFARREVGKEYLALVYGVPRPGQGRVEAPIGRDVRNKTRMAVYAKARPSLDHGAREARSDYRTLYADPLGRFALLAVRLHSGRTHQIRVHLTHIGHPIVGDKVYTDEAAVKKALSPRGLEAELRSWLSGLADHQLLHAWRLHFAHPAEGAEGAEPAKGTEGLEVAVDVQGAESEGAASTEGEMRFCADPPPDFKNAALALSDRLLRVVLTGNPACGKSSVLKLLREHGLPVWSADAAVAREYRAGADGWRLLRAQYGDRFLLPEKGSAPNGSAADGSADGRALTGAAPVAGNAAGNYAANPTGYQAGDVDKNALFRAMCADDRLRRDVEGIIHPIVLAAMLAFWEGLDAPPPAAPTAVAEVPLYLESAGSGRNAPGEARPGGAPAGLFPGFAPARPLLVGIHCPFSERARRLRENRSWPEAMIEKIESWQWPEEKKMAACDLVIDNSGSPEQLAAEVRSVLARLEALRRDRLEALGKILDELSSCANR